MGVFFGIVPNASPDALTQNPGTGPGFVSSLYPKSRRIGADVSRVPQASPAQAAVLKILAALALIGSTASVATF